jgi:hypothetical protein
MLSLWHSSTRIKSKLSGLVKLALVAASLASACAGLGEGVSQGATRKIAVDGLPDIDARTYSVGVVRKSRSGRVYLLQLKGPENPPKQGKIILLKNGSSENAMAFRVLKIYPDKRQIAAKSVRKYDGIQSLATAQPYTAVEKLADVSPTPLSQQDRREIRELERPPPPVAVTPAPAPPTQPAPRLNPPQAKIQSNLPKVISPPPAPKPTVAAAPPPVAVAPALPPPAPATPAAPLPEPTLPAVAEAPSPEPTLPDIPPPPPAEPSPQPSGNATAEAFLSDPNATPGAVPSAEPSAAPVDAELDNGAPLKINDDDSPEALTEKEQQDIDEMSKIVVQETTTYEREKQWLSVSFGYFLNYKDSQLNPQNQIYLAVPVYFSGAMVRYGINIAHDVFLSRGKTQDSLTLEGGVGFYKVINIAQANDGDSFSIVPTTVTARYNLFFGGDTALFFYLGVNKNFLLAYGYQDPTAANAVSAAYTDLQSLNPAIGTGLLFRLGPNWYVRTDIGYDVIDLGLVLRF